MQDNRILDTNKVLYGYVVGDGRPIPKLLGYLYFYIYHFYLMPGKKSMEQN